MPFAAARVAAPGEEPSAGPVAAPGEEASAGPLAAPGEEAPAAALGEAVTAEPDGMAKKAASMTLIDPGKTREKVEQAGKVSPRKPQDRGAGL